MRQAGTSSHDVVAKAVLASVGGAENVVAVTSCFTRLRFVLKNTAAVDKAALEQIDGVISVVSAGGQLQVVIGSDVPSVREAVERLLPAATTDDSPVVEEKGNLFDRFIALISSLFQPILWVLAGTGLLKAFLMVVSMLGWVAQDSTTYVILNAGADSLFYFLPMFLAFTAAKRFNANPFVSLALAGGLVYPTITALSSSGDPVTFLGIPVVMTSYTSSVVPIIVIVWVQGYLERWFKKVLPKTVMNFLSPALVVLILFPLSLMTIGPATTYLSKLIADGVGWMFTVSPAIAGFIIGGLAQALVVFGLHWAIIAVIINEYGTVGHSYTIIPFYAAVTAQTGAAFAVFLRTRSARLKQVAGPATLSGFLAGITEPILYGVNLPLRRPFIIGLISGAVGGSVAMASGVASNAFAVPSLITMPVALGQGNFAVFVAGVVGAMVLAFILTLFFGVKDPDADVPGASRAPQAPDATVPADARTASILAPVAGMVRGLDSVSDKVFASGSMGHGVGLLPADGRLVAPVSGEVIACMPHAYGIRTDDGVEVLVHIGIDTVKLNGQHFSSAVSAGSRVSAGDLLATVDLDAVKAAGYDPTVVVVVTNSASLGGVEPLGDQSVTAGEPLIRIGS